MSRASVADSPGHTSRAKAVLNDSDAHAATPPSMPNRGPMPRSIWK